MDKRYKDIAGQKFGSLVAVKYVRSDPKGHAIWLCKCDCGKEKEIRALALLSNHTKSCGHLQKRHSGEHIVRDNPRLYRTWKNMRSRCNNPNNKSYYLYGAKGVKVCDEWNSFRSFMDWAYTNGYDSSAEYGECTIDRINSDGDYSPDNCRFADAKVQSQNRKNVHKITYQGKTQTMSEWSKEFGIPLSTLYVRLSRGYDIETALTNKRLPRKAR